VIGILVVLGAIVFVGVHHVRRPAQENATRTTLGNLQGMLADLDNANKLAKGPRDWLWTQDDSATKTAQACNYASFDFWRGPSNNTTTTWAQDYALVSPGSVAEDGAGLAGNQRHASIAVVNTELAMSMLASLPENRSRLQAMTQQQQFVPTWHSGQIALPNGSPNITFVAGSHVQYQGKQYVASATFPTNGNPTPGGGGEWIDITGKLPPAPLLLDSWNNPIIFVPATGLRVRLSNDPSKVVIVVSPEGEANNTVAPPTIIRPGRPFFASAGPDGDFTAGDDNVYSFEK
jgi:hypothetical protein